MNDPLYVGLVLLHGFMLTWAIYIGYRQNRPVLLTASATLLAMNVVFANIADERPLGLFYDNDLKKTMVAQLYCTISDAIILFVNFPSIAGGHAKRDRFDEEIATIDDTGRSALILCGFFATCLGFASFIFRIIHHGGVEDVWKRTWDTEPDDTPFKGLLVILSNYVLFYFYVIYYLHINGRLKSLFFRATAWASLAVAFGLFTISGTTTGPLLCLLPVGLLLVQKNHAISMKRFILFTLLMTAAITFLRFARHVGKETNGGASGVSISTDSLSSYSDSEVGLTNSFVMLQAFAQVISRIDGGDPMLWGGSYVMIPGSLLPGLIYPGGTMAKHEFMMNNRPDVYTLERLTSRTFEGWLPSGYYGEAYMNFGFLGLVGISVIVGAVILKLDGRYRTRFLGLPGTFIIPLMISPVVDSIRMYVCDAFNIALCQVGLFALMYQFFRITVFCVKSILPQVPSATRTAAPRWPPLGAWPDGRAPLRHQAPDERSEENRTGSGHGETPG